MSAEFAPAPARMRSDHFRRSTPRQTLMAASLLVPFGATAVLAAAKLVWRHHAAAVMAQAARPAAPVLSADGTRFEAAASARWLQAPAAPATVSRVVAYGAVQPNLDPARTLRLGEAMLRRVPNDAAVRQATVSAALAAGKLDRAELLAREGVELSPSEPRAWVASAEVARVRGDRHVALREYARARALRMQELGYSDNGDDDSTLPAVTLTPGGEPYRGRASTRSASGPAYAQNGSSLSVPPGLLPPVGTPSSAAPGVSSPPGGFGDNLDTSARELIPPSLPSGEITPPAGGGVIRTPLPASTSPRGVPAPLAPATPQGAAVTPAFPAPSTGVVTSGNPFRPASRLQNGDSLSPAGTPDAAANDPLTQMIDRDIAALSDTGAPSVQAGFGFRVRTGDNGLGRLDEYTTPIEGEFSPGGYGRVKVSMTPTFLTAGKVDSNVAELQSFGTSAFNLRSPGEQHAVGVAPALSYAYDDITADIGLTPVGFTVTNPVGGVQWTPRLADNLALRVIAEDRAITDSLLSYAGTRDPNTGTTFGGVTRARGRVNLEATLGLASLYAGAGGGVLDGEHVQQNTEIEAGAGGSIPVYRDGAQELRVGLDLVYLSYDRNLGFFTLGQGGYFSPQQYFAAIVPLNWRDKPTDDLTYEVGIGGGIQTFRQRSSPYYPIDPILQQELVAQQNNAATAIPGVGAIHGGSHETGFAGNAHAAIDYRVTPNIHVGGNLAVEHAGNYTEGSGLVYARYIFNDAGQPQ